MSRKQQDAPVPFLKRWQDITLGIAIVAVCGGFFLLRDRNAAPAHVARVYLDSQEILELPLRLSDNYRIHLSDDYGVPVSLELQDGGIRFVDVTCPDHICEKTGVLAKDGETAVCMPNRVAVVVGEA